MSIQFTETYSHILFDDAVEKPVEESVVSAMLTHGGDPIEPAETTSVEEHVEVLKAEPSKDYDRLSAEVAVTKLEYVPVEMPCHVHADGSFTFGGDPREYRFTPMGVSYLGERFKTFKSGQWVGMWAERAYPALETYLNADPDAQEDGASRRFILCIYNGEVVGTPKRYIPVQHKRLLDAVEAAGLASAVEPSGVGYREMWINIHTAHVMNAEKKEVAKVGLRIANGHSGHTALRYYAYCTAGEHYEYAISLGKGRSRHLGKVEELVDDLAEMEKTAASIDFEMSLKSLSIDFGYLVASAIEGKKHETDVMRIAVSSKNGLDFFESLVALVDNRDYRVVARTALNVLMEKALSH